MKRIAIVPLIMSVLLTGCSGINGSSASKPTDINVGKDVMSYYDSKSDIPESIYKLTTFYEDASVKNSYADSIDIVMNDDNEIRAIYINSDDVITYQNISVGATKTEVKDSYLYEVNSPDHCVDVLFDGDKEVNRYEENTIEDDYIWLVYYFDDDDILYRIMIYDYKFGRTGR